jgi:hypothetical protein
MDLSMTDRCERQAGWRPTERKLASITAMFLTEPSNGTGNSVPWRMLFENKSP